MKFEDKVKKLEEYIKELENDDLDAILGGINLN